MAPFGVVKLRKANADGTLVMTLPAALAHQLEPMRSELLFRAELTDDGILFRLITGSEIAPTTPAWVMNGKDA